MFAVQFAAFFLFILVLGYLLPAGQFYYKYHLRSKPEQEELRIQHRRPTRKQIWREIRMSLVTIAIFAVGATILWRMYLNGQTSIYRNWGDYPWYYVPVSFVLCLLIHDTYFYWTHRLMHWRPVFKYVHLGHHRSVSPTPWAIFAFQPLEAIIQFAGIMFLVIFIPLQPLVLLAFLSYDSLVNTAGHTGFEVVPKWMARSWLYRGFNTVTHHDTHHTNMKVNYGAFFNIWDRWMGTFQDDAPEPAAVPASKPARARGKTHSPAV